MKKDIIVITGGASGIGKSLAESFLKSGERVVALDLNQKELSKILNWARSYGYDFSDEVLSVTDLDAIKKFILKTEHTNTRIKIWINSAGISGIGEFKKIDKNEYDQIIKINLLSIIDLTRSVLTHMEKEGLGTIVNISSVAGFIPAPFMSGYNLTKHALVGFTRSMQEEVKYTDSPVKFVLVCPGFVETNMIQKGEKTGFPEWLSMILASPETVAEEIIDAIKKGKSEVVPTLNGKALVSLHHLFPRLVRSQAKMLTVKNLKDFILNRH
jgi:3-hydroxybutyrate dehydrogenase